MAAPLAGLSAGGFAMLSAIRRNRVFHPVGEAFDGALGWETPSDAPEALRVLDGNHEVIVRFSRGAGLPEPMPDVLGIAIKIPAGATTKEQDLLLASCGAPPVTRNLLVPAKSFFRCTFSSVLPYRAGEETFLFGAHADATLKDREGDFGDLQQLASEGTLRFELLFAGLTGDWSRLGTLDVTGQRSQETAHELKFNPWNTQGGIEPAGPLNTLRLATYRSSQKARPTTDS